MAASTAIEELLERAARGAVEWIAETWNERNEPPEGALWRGWKDTRRASTHWFYFRIPALLVTAAFAVWGALLPSSASPGERAVLAVGGVLGGAAIVGVVTFVILTVSAPLRQRNEARETLSKSRNAQAGSDVGEDPQAQARRNASHALVRIADDIDAHRDARDAQEPTLAIDPLTGTAWGAMQRKMRGEVDNVTAYRRETLALYYMRFRVTALSAYKEALRLQTGQPDRVTLIEKPGDLEGLLTVVGYLREAAEELDRAAV